MAKKRYGNKFRDGFSSLNKDDIYFGMIYEGMLKSEPYQKLSIGAKQFYTVCRVQAQTKACRACLAAHGRENNREYVFGQDFVFPAKQIEQYGLKRQNAYKYFKELQGSGFITVKEANHNQRKINVYSFSANWKK